MKAKILVAAAIAALVVSSPAFAQFGRKLPSEKKVVIDPITGVPLTFLTTSPVGDNKLYQTHQPWTADGKWVIFSTSRPTEGGGNSAGLFAVNEETGVMVQVTEGGGGSPSVAQKSMKLYYTRGTGGGGRGRGATTAPAAVAAAPAGQPPATQPGRGGRGFGGGGQTGVYELDLAKLLPDALAGTVKDRSVYERLCGTLPAGLGVSGGFGLDANEDFVYLGVRGGDTGQHLPVDTKIATTFGPRNMGAGPSGLRSMNLKTGEVKVVIDVPFQIGHVQTNPFMPGEIIYCWETGGKAPTRAWVVSADGTNNRPVYNERESDWVTHEAVITKDEVAVAIMGHRRIGTGADSDWGVSGTREFGTGLAVINLRTKDMRIEAQTPSGSGLWHVNGSYDGRWLVGDDFSRSIWLTDRKTSEMVMLSTGHRPGAQDHPHPIFNQAGTKILIQSAMIAPDERAHDLCVIPIPKTFLNRTYSQKLPE